ncbi:MAG: hypothetical protein IJZ66_08335, partial [Oscillibacter sp.]|nr:hypothetical protein [Oscillibacter sp.]
MRKHHSSTRKHTPYFEGWYLKYQTRDGNALALIPAIHTDKEGRRSVSLQVITANETWWLPYSLQECALSKAHFPISMGETRFDVQQVQLHVEKKGLSLHGALNHGPFAPLRSDIMGPFRFFSGMECSHGVISMGHALTGVLELNGTVLDFSGGLGYAETDRGRSFPRTYLWTQCTWQEPQLSSLMLSIAHIPWGWGHFTGCICA